MTRALWLFLFFSTLMAAQCPKSPGPVVQSRFAGAPPEVRELASQLSRPYVAIPQVIAKRFGRPRRGSRAGAEYLEWRLPTGKLIYEVGRLKYQNDAGSETWILGDPTTILQALQSRSFAPVSPPDLNDRKESLLLGANASYHFILDPKYRDHPVQAERFFLEHPKGTYVIQFESGCFPSTKLEMLKGGTKVGSVLLSPGEKYKTEVLRIITSESGASLVLHGTKDLKFASHP